MQEKKKLCKIVLFHVQKELEILSDSHQNTKRGNKIVLGILMLCDYVLLLPKIILSSTVPSHITTSFCFLSITVRISSIKLETVLADFSAEQS